MDIAAVAELAVVARLLGAGRGEGVETVGDLHHTNSCTLLTLDIINITSTDTTSSDIVWIIGVCSV